MDRDGSGEGGVASWAESGKYSRMLFGIVVMGALVTPIKFKDEIISLYGCSRSYGQDLTGIRSSKFVEIQHRTNGHAQDSPKLQWLTIAK